MEYEIGLTLDNRTAVKGRVGADALLEELAVDRGMAWSDIARFCGVTVSAVRKWRVGLSISPERRRALARLSAFLDLLEESGPVGDPAGWLAMRLSEHHTVTAGDLYLDGRAEDVLQHAQGRLSASELLDRWKPDWHIAARSEWSVATTADGDRVLTRRS